MLKKPTKAESYANAQSVLQSFWNKPVILHHSDTKSIVALINTVTAGSFLDCDLVLQLDTQALESSTYVQALDP